MQLQVTVWVIKSFLHKKKTKKLFLWAKWTTVEKFWLIQEWNTTAVCCLEALYSGLFGTIFADWVQKRKHLAMWYLKCTLFSIQFIVFWTVKTKNDHCTGFVAKMAHYSEVGSKKKATVYWRCHLYICNCGFCQKHWDHSMWTILNQRICPLILTLIFLGCLN